MFVSQQPIQRVSQILIIFKLFFIAHDNYFYKLCTQTFCLILSFKSLIYKIYFSNLAITLSTNLAITFNLFVGYPFFHASFYFISRQSQIIPEVNMNSPVLVWCLVHTKESEPRSSYLVLLWKRKSCFQILLVFLYGFQLNTK